MASFLSKLRVDRDIKLCDGTKINKFYETVCDKGYLHLRDVLCGNEEPCQGQIAYCYLIKSTWTDKF